MKTYRKDANGTAGDSQLLTSVLCVSLFFTSGAFADHAKLRTEMIEAYEAYALQKTGQHDRAFAAWMALAQKGNAHGILNVANAYLDGKGVEKDPAEAVRWYRRGAAQGDPHCLYHLARAYETGLGLPADKDKADVHFRLAAAAGSADAQAILARALLDENKTDEARQWLRRAAQNGNQEAVRLLARLSTAVGPQTNAPLTDDRRLRIARLLGALDAAANARDADLLTNAITAQAEISVRLPGQPSAQRMSKEAYRALWQATFERTERYRFARTEFEETVSGDGVRVRSNIREYLTSGDRTQLLVLAEEITVDLSEAEPRITKVVLDVERR